jgi:hypothetical protein
MSLWRSQSEWASVSGLGFQPAYSYQLEFPPLLTTDCRCESRQFYQINIVHKRDHCQRLMHR